METLSYSVKKPNPDVGSVYSHGWNQLIKYFLPALLIIIIVGAISMPIGWINSLYEFKYFLRSCDSSNIRDFLHNYNYSIPPSKFAIGSGIILIKLFSLFYWLFLIVPIEYGAKLLYLRIARGEQFEVSEIFAAFKQKYLNVILANLLTAAIIVTGFIFCIIPGIIFACRLAFVPYLVMDKNMDPVAAVENSWKMTKGHGFTIFFMALLTIPLFIGGLIAFFIGIFFVIMWVHIAFASMYFAVDNKSE